MAQPIRNITHLPQNSFDLNDFVNRAEASLKLLETAELSLVLRTKLVQTWRFTLSKLKHLKKKSATSVTADDLKHLQKTVLPNMLRDQAEMALIILRASGNGHRIISSWEQLWSDLLGLRE